MYIKKMTKHGKKYNEWKKTFDSQKAYSVEEAVELIKKLNYVKFDSTIEIAIKTGANPKFNDQMIRATTILPNGTGKTKKIAVFANDDKLEEAKKSWADIVGSDTLITDIKNWKFDFDILITTPDSIRNLATIAKLLWPKGLMPSPKAGTVTTDIKTTVEEFKKWKIEFRLDKTGNIHAGVGKMSFDEKMIAENIESLLQTIEEHRPTGVKGKLIQKVVVSSTMSPGIVIDYKGK